MTNRDKKLRELVIVEATNLKANATKSELSHLDFKTLNPSHQERCIYGQITGNCFNVRAIDLIKDCCAKIYKADGNSEDALVDNQLNGSPKKDSRVNYFSPIEVFIYQLANRANGNNKALVNFLKGNTKTLEFV